MALEVTEAELAAADAYERSPTTCGSASLSHRVGRPGCMSTPARPTRARESISADRAVERSAHTARPAALVGPRRALDVQSDLVGPVAQGRLWNVPLPGRPVSGERLGPEADAVDLQIHLLIRTAAAQPRVPFQSQPVPRAAPSGWRLRPATCCARPEGSVSASPQPRAAPVRIVCDFEPVHRRIGLARVQPILADGRPTDRPSGRRPRDHPVRCAAKQHLHAGVIAGLEPHPCSQTNDMWVGRQQLRRRHPLRRPARRRLTPRRESSSRRHPATRVARRAPSEACSGRALAGVRVRPPASAPTNRSAPPSRPRSLASNHIPSGSGWHWRPPVS